MTGVQTCALPISEWYTDDAKDIAWSIGMLYPSLSLAQPMYDDDFVGDPAVTDPIYEGYLVQEWRADGRVEFRYAGPFADDAPMPAFPDSGETWDDTAWEIAESDARDLAPVDTSVIGMPKWQFTNWVTGGTVLPDGKYFGVVIGTDDIGHQTGIPVGNAPRVLPDVVTFHIDNNVASATLLAAELKPDGTLDIVTNNEMERGRPLVLYIDETFQVADLDKVTFYFKLKHDYAWTEVDATIQGATASTQPYLVTLSPLGGWDGISNGTGHTTNIVLGATYQFKAVVEDNIGNKGDSNIIELVIVDKVAEADIARIDRIDGLNADEMYLLPNMINDMIAAPRLTGRVRLWGFADADTVGVTFLYRSQGADAWVEIEAMHKTSFGTGEFSNSDPWDRSTWMTDGLDNDGDGYVDEPGESG